MNKIKAIILDWAGTTIDYGSMTPIYAMKSAFLKYEIELNDIIIRKYMGLHKQDHIQKILEEPEIINQLNFNSNEEITNLAQEIFEQLLRTTKEVAINRTKPINGVIDFIENMKDRGIKIGSATGYTREMMSNIIPIAENYGLKFDSIVCPDEVGYGRPFPFMIYKNLINLKSFPLWEMVKIGDTVADIYEGLNAGMWVISVTKTGNEVGYSEEEINNISSEILQEKIMKATDVFYKAGSHYVVESVGDAYDIINEINERIANGELPNHNRTKEQNDR